MFQIITLAGRPVAAIVGDRAIVTEQLGQHDRRHVHAMALYALEIATGDRPGPYNDDDAERYAHTVTRRIGDCTAPPGGARPR